MKIAVDTNILAYAAGVGSDDRRAKARAVLATLSATVELVAPLQVLGELFNVLVKKGGLSRKEAQEQVRTWRAFMDSAMTTESVFQSGLDLAASHRLTIWDALILAASVEAGCDLLLSEDMQNGFAWRGLTVVNPFAEPLSPLLEGAIRP